MILGDLAKKRNFNLLSVGYPIELDINTRDRCLRPVPRHLYLCRTALPFVVVIVVFLTGAVLADVDFNLRRDEIGVISVVDFEADGSFAFL